jgi:putative ABC transport system permease protein
MESLLQDLRIGVRMLLKSPGVSAVAVLCIALALGVHSTIFNVVNAVLLRPLPFADPERTVAVHLTSPQQSSWPAALSYLEFQDFRDQATSYSTLAAYTGRSLTLIGQGEPERVWGLRVTANLFPLLGFQPALGRGFRPEDEHLGAPGVILLDHDLWQRRYSGDPRILGRAITVNGRSHTVIGVMPPGFRFRDSKEAAWIPLLPLAEDRQRGERTLDVLGRLAPGVTLEQATLEARAIAARLAKSYPETNAGWGATILTLRQELVGPRRRPIMLTLLGAVTCILLIACSNVANLLFARGAGRQREIALRTAFGAGRLRLIRQLLVESLVLALAGGVLGVLLSVAGMRGVQLLIRADDAPPPWMAFTIDTRSLLAAFATALAAGLLFGLAPALQSTRSPLGRTLQEGGRTTAGSRRQNLWRSGLVVVQMSLSLLLLIAAALFVRSFRELQRESPGFDTASVLTLRLFLTGERYEDPLAKSRRVEDIVRRLEALPGVAAASASNLVPFDGGGSDGAVLIDGRPVAPGEEPQIYFTGVTSHFLRSLEARPLAGRDFTATEGASKAPVALVNQTFARRLFPGGQAVGRRFRIKGEEDGRWLTVIGVIADLRTEGPDARLIPPSAYLPYPWLATPNTGFTLRTHGDPAQLAAAARREIRAADPDIPVTRMETLEEVRERAFWDNRIFGILFTVFGTVALILATIGVYGVLSYGVSQRLHEIGIRLAVGARKAQILGLVVRQGMALAAAGVALGLLAAFASTRVLANLLWVSASDPASFVSMPLLLGGVAFLASYLPALRATEVDPLQTLREE